MLPDYTLSSFWWSHQAFLIHNEQKDLLHLCKVSRSPGFPRTRNAFHGSHNYESDGDELSCTNINSDEDIRLRESDCEESEENADIIENIPVNLDLYIDRDDTEGIPHNSNVPGSGVAEKFRTPL
ncbi:hypothetical protein TNCV_4572301 [Trichonephila clavipes]|nr:hypothetical protein TNCV_4572301 [Trichonephila clavipes]